MFDWLGDIVGGLFGSKDNGVGGLFSKIAGAVTGSLSGTPPPQSLMRPRSILDNTGPSRQYGNSSPSAHGTGAAQAASFDEINLKWERRMSRIMNKKTTMDD